MANKIKLVSSFADETTRSVEFSGFDDGDAVLTPNTLRGRIQDVNSDTSAFASYYLSDDGATFTAITGATIIENSETEIALK